MPLSERSFLRTRRAATDERAPSWARAVRQGADNTVRLGIRLQLLFAIGALLLLAFVPLFFAVASLTRATMSGARASSARAIGRAIAGHVAAARTTRSAPELSLLLEAQVGPDGASAIGVYDAAGALSGRAGEPEIAAALPASVEAGTEVLKTVRTARGDALLVVVPEPAREAAPLAEPAPAASTGSVAVLVPTDPSTVAAAPLVRIVALYTGIVALALLVFAYISMTHLVVRPIDAVSQAARRVAGGARDLEVPRAGARELAELGASLALMTGRLRADEESLRAKIAEVERYAADLKSAQERLVRSERLASVGRLAAGLAHEIGNPLAAILGLQDLLLAGGLTPAEERDFVERMKRETERIHKILRDLLDFARPAARGAAEAGDDGEAGRHPSGSVAEAIDDVVSLVAPQRAFRAIELERDVAPDVPAVPLAHGQLVQVLLNLLLNAADAVPRVGGRVAVRASRGACGGARIEVEDNGPGIAEEVRETLFEPFITTKEVGEGTGLGLAVCRGLVEAAGGSIGVERGADGGARFVVLLPGAAQREASEPR
ncbi:sensor histidine kinase [Sorangium atrum]|uniref:histidine kinase n=1 Tax=Sorangium atrum TaxID=2995308 RepID=A0ABT5BYB1_9BACT|nr:HAMP domain-containing sensor histidine kinase [Sorangium aterium]MDC0679142.1 HAMP domain-containing sensor histidine kinase [Sorangium aterium]